MGFPCYRAVERDIGEEDREKVAKDRHQCDCRKEKIAPAQACEERGVLVGCVGQEYGVFRGAVVVE